MSFPRSWSARASRSRIRRWSPPWTPSSRARRDAAASVGSARATAVGAFEDDRAADRPASPLAVGRGVIRQAEPVPRAPVLGPLPDLVAILRKDGLTVLPPDAAAWAPGNGTPPQRPARSADRPAWQAGVMQWNQR